MTMQGAQIPGCPRPLKFDHFSPHAFLDAFINCRPECNLGAQHDARVALEEILTRAGLGSTLFNTGVASFDRPDVVTLPSFAQEGAWCYKKFTEGVDAQLVVKPTIDMRALLRSGFAHLGVKLRECPPLLAVVIPPFAQEDDMFYYLSSLFKADWGDGTLELLDCCENDDPQRTDARYRIAAYVEHVGDEAITPAWTFIGGHFRAVFREGGCWYEADDSRVRQVDADLPFPHICFLERTNLAAVTPWEPSACNLDAEDAVAQDTSTKRRRLIGKQEPPEREAGGRQQKRDREGRLLDQDQDRAGRHQHRQQDQGRSGRHQDQDRSGRPQDRQQDRADRTRQQQHDLRQRTTSTVGDNTDSSIRFS